MDEKILAAFLSEIEKIAATHEDVMKRLQEGPSDTGAPNVKSPVAETARKFDPKVIREQLRMKQKAK